MNNRTLVNNIFKEGELESKSNLHFLHIANSDKPVAFYNLDVIISVGYRVKSKQGTKFRQWATPVLRDYVLKGYVINQRLTQIDDRFLLIDNDLYHVGASLKDLGKKLFAFSKMEMTAGELLKNI